MKENLRPCPFCGREADVKYIGNEHTKTRTIETKCQNINCRATMKHGAIRFGFEWLENVSAKAWNRRVN